MTEVKTLTPPAKPPGADDSPSSPLHSYARVFTPSFFILSIIALFGAAFIVQYCEVFMAAPGAIGEQALALPAVWIFLFMLLAGTLTFAISRIRPLSRAQFLALFYILTLAAPLMSQGFWHRMVSMTATVPRSPQQFDKLDLLSDKLWPHGPNLLAAQPTAETRGTVSSQSLQISPQKSAPGWSLQNTAADQSSSIRFRIPSSLASPGEPFLITALFRAKNLGGESRYFIRLHAENLDPPLDIYSGNALAKPTVTSPAGFLRLGAPTFTIPETSSPFLDIEILLLGRGTLEVADPVMVSVYALNSLYTGRSIINQKDLASLPPSQRFGVIVRPDNLWSLDGLKFLLAGNIPLHQWLTPLASWGILLLLIFLGFFALSILMREQWVQRERFPLPLTRIPLSLLGDDQNSLPLLKNSMAWTGLSVGLLWGLWQFLAQASPGLTDPALNVDLKTYISSPNLRPMFEGTTFQISIIFVALFLLMELNVLLSIVVGYWLFRAQFWIGQINGWTSQPAFPYRNEQTLASYLSYALILVALSWRHLREIFRACLGQGTPAHIRTYRTASIVLLVSVGAGLAWGNWAGIGLAGSSLLFLSVLAVGFVAAKLRAECGIVQSYFAPYNLALITGLVGGIAVLGAPAVLFFVVISFVLANGGLFLVSGGQLELLEIGRQSRMRTRTISTVVALALFGGLVIGGWVFLSGAYSVGGQQMRYTWPFDSKDWYLRDFDGQMLQANTAAAGATPADSPAATSPVWYAYGFASIGTAALTIVRQILPGFWFHPIGFVLGSTYYSDTIWGSALVAWLVRRIVAWMGGAATVRSKLQPFAVGLFVGGVLAVAIGMLCRSLGYPPPVGG